MKTLRMITLLSAVAFTLFFITANATGVKTNPVTKAVNMSLEEALQNPSLVVIMHRQLDSGFLMLDQESYTKSVYYHSYIIRITGTHDQWERFFTSERVVFNRLYTPQY